MPQFSLSNKKLQPFGLGLLILSIVYLGLVTAYLLYYHGLPYIFDNNESFSTIIHAKNLVQHDFFSSYGLTDESYGLLRESHPYVYTHQGNFPRIFASILYLLGLHSVELQIIATVAIVNSLALYFAYSYFARIVSPLFALVFCLVLLTNYVFNFQWIFNTLQVWHGFFIFSTLILVEKYQNIDSKFYTPLLLINFVVCSYYEIAFAAYVVTLACSLFIFKYKKVSLWLKPVVLILMGAGLGFAVLVVQSIMYFKGYQGFLKDLSLTFIARNNAPSNPLDFAKIAEQIWSFVEANNLVWWDNFVSHSQNLRSLVTGSKLYFKYNLEPYTPLYLLAILSICLAMIFTLFEGQIKTYVQKNLVDLIHKSEIKKSTAAIVISMICVLVVFKFYWITGSDPLQFLTTTNSFIILLLSFAALYFWVYENIEYRPVGVGGEKIIFLLIFYAALMCYASTQIHHFNLDDIYSYPGSTDLWKIIFFNDGSRAFSKIIWISIILFGLFTITNDPIYTLNKIQKEQLVNLAPFIGASVLGGCIAWFCISGYVFSVYYSRYAPFFIFFNSLILCIPIYTLTLLTNNFVTKLREISSKQTNKAIIYISYGVRAIPLLVIYLFLIAGWVLLQASHFKIFDSNTNILLKKLAQSPYISSSIVTNAYAAPFAFQANQWAYFDPAFGSGRINRTEKGYFYANNDKYLWLADKNQQSKYQYPDYFVCSMNSHYDFVLGFNPRCDMTVNLVKRAKGLVEHHDFSDLIKPTLSEIDPSGNARWAIVKLDKDFPPFLRPYKNNRMIEIINKNNTLQIFYQFKHQLNVKQGASQIDLYELKTCKAGEPHRLVAKGIGSIFGVEKYSPGTYRVSVIPHTASKPGEVYWSQPFQLGNKEFKYCDNSPPITPPYHLGIEFTPDGRNALLKWDSHQNWRLFDIQESIDGRHYGALKSIDGNKRDISLGRPAQTLNKYYRMRACNDWKCSVWVERAPS